MSDRFRQNPEEAAYEALDKLCRELKRPVFQYEVAEAMGLRQSSVKDRMVRLVRAGRAFRLEGFGRRAVFVARPR